MTAHLATHRRSIAAAAMAMLIALALLVQGTVTAQPAAAATVTTTINHSDTTTVQGTVNKTFYTGEWGFTSRSHYATTGASFEVAFTGSKFELWGLTNTGHGKGRVFVDGSEIALVDYRGPRITTAKLMYTKDALTEGSHTLRVVVDGGYIDHSKVVVTADDGISIPVDDLRNAYRAAQIQQEVDYTAASWPAFAAARSAAGALGDGGTTQERAAAISALRAATDALVEIGGLHSLLEDYQQRVPADFTPASWEPFAAQITAAQSVLADPGASRTAVVAAKNGLQAAAAGLVTVSEGTFQPITNNTFWRDTDGNPIYSQGGGIFQYGDTYYWYGVRYKEAAAYHASPSRIYSTSTFESIPVYSSKDLVNWKFENNVATQDTLITVPESKGHYFAQMQTLADAIWVGRLGVSYNENTGNYVLMVQSGQGFDPSGAQRGMVLFLQGDSPTDDFEYGNIQPQIVGSPTKSTGDQTVFTDDDGTDYLIFSNSGGRANAYVSKIAEADSLTIDPAVAVGYVPAGREGNAMFKLDGKYYMLTSDLHGWNASANHVIESLSSDIQGRYSPEYTLPGSEKDYSLVSQTGFFVTVHGTKQDTVLYAGDRWADFAWNGLGYNQWVPLTKSEDGIAFNSLTNWEFNAVTGEWRAGAGNNYILNPDFAADRVPVTQLTGWTTTVDTDYSPASFVSNSSPGADSSRFALRLGNADRFSGSVDQQDALPSGLYKFTAQVNTAGGLEHARIVVRGAADESYTVDINSATTGWQSVSLGELRLTGGTVTVSIEARSAGGNQSVRVDALSLVKQPTDAAALRAVYDANSGRDATAYTATSWKPFTDALTAAEATLADPAATQAAIDSAASALTATSGELAPAVASITAAVSKVNYAVGASFDPTTLTVTAKLADGSTSTLPAGGYTVSGFRSDVAGPVTLTVTVDPGLVATGGAGVTATVALAVYPAWSVGITYPTGQKVLYNNAVWLAAWKSKAQTPGDPYGPWQEIREENGVAVWTASRVFVAGNTVIHEGRRYTAKWWTRNQAPGDPYGPWQPTG
ncbi:family 43 glycosylhydrolase [Microbacterium sp. SS28]|uniref:family 43 glycosylhydrolase n=1 Tax=Microbacterium sp. SS28 TaxID=2919948 RepID=UPI001FAA80AD|nr:family 43 glycosylhydrolase [Microbacterium sp. SS28]